MNSLEAGRIAAEAGAGHLLLTHLPHFGEHQKLAEEAKTCQEQMSRTRFCSDASRFEAVHMTGASPILIRIKIALRDQ